MAPRLRIAVLALAASLCGWFIVPCRAQTPDAAKGSISPEQMLEEALVRYDAGDFNEAYNYAQRVRGIKPDLPKLKLVDGLLALERRPKDAPRAIQFLTEYNLTPDGVNDYRGNAALGRVYKDSRMYQIAIRPLEKAKGLAPPEAGGKPIRALVTMDLAECYYGMKKDKKALETAKDAETSAPNDPEVLMNLSQIAFNTKEYDTSVRAADRAIGVINARLRASPFKVDDIKNLAVCVDQKIKVFNSRIADNSKDAQTYYDLATAIREKAEVARRTEMLRSREYAIKGIANDPKFFKLQVFVAGLEAELGGLQDAIDRLNDTINNDPENQAAIKLRGEIQARFAATPH